ncbi:MAG: hypothetical protein ACI8WY_000877, partial [Planctomycetota bacterium]
KPNIESKVTNMADRLSHEVQERAKLALAVKYRPLTGFSKLE